MYCQDLIYMVESVGFFVLQAMSMIYLNKRYIYDQSKTLVYLCCHA